MNDIFGLYISYYILNSFEFILIGVLLLIGSIVCVNLNKFNRNLRANNYYELLTLFDFFDDFVKFFFMRKQNLTDQTIHPSATRIFKKKVSK
jgi:ABC-type transport system involved in multi-copper enzyme maturation permease subunit